MLCREPRAVVMISARLDSRCNPSIGMVWNWKNDAIRRGTESYPGPIICRIILSLRYRKLGYNNRAFHFYTLAKWKCNATASEANRNSFLEWQVRVSEAALSQYIHVHAS
jgi:hypothetical protein